MSVFLNAPNISELKIREQLKFSSHSIQYVAFDFQKSADIGVGFCFFETINQSLSLRIAPYAKLSSFV